jgi:ribosomal protein S30
LSYNPQEEKKKKKRDPRFYQRQKEERRILRLAEREADKEDLE